MTGSQGKRVRLARLSRPLALVLFFAMVLLVGANAIAAGVLLSVGGVLLFVRGFLMLRYRDVLQELARRELLGPRMGLHIETVTGAVGLLFIGTGWCGAGVAIAFGA